MKIATWIFQGILIACFGLFGLQKVVMPIPDLIAFGMLWIEDFPAWQVRLIGGLEVLAVLGLMGPYLIKFLPRILVSLAAAGLALTMVGGTLTHVLRNDPMITVVINLALLAMSAFVAYRRYQEA